MSSHRVIGVGLIGVQPRRSWSAVAHLPALARLPDQYFISGIANSSAESGRIAALELGGLRAFPSVNELLESEDVDLAVITVKVPHHAELVRSALAAGKHVLCEWPLARDLSEAIKLQALAASSGLVVATGLQGIFAPAVQAVKAMRLADGLGQLLSSTLVANGMTWGGTIESRNAYLLDGANGATMLSIAVGHALSAVEVALGRIVDVQAAVASQRKDVTIAETGEIVPMTSPDQILLACTIEGGLPLSIHYRGGPPRGKGLNWIIDGREASARIVGPSGLIEMAPLELQEFRSAGDGWNTVLSPVDRPQVDNVQRLYEQLANRIACREATVPDFDDAVRLHRILNAIEESAISGRRLVVGG